MDPFTMALLIGGGTGLLKNELVDKPKERRQRKLAAATQRLSPWTGMQANEIQEANAFNNMLQGGATAGSMYSGWEASQADKAYKDALTNRLNQGGSIVGYGKPEGNPLMDTGVFKGNAYESPYMSPNPQGHSGPMTMKGDPRYMLEESRMFGPYKGTRRTPMMSSWD